MYGCEVWGFYPAKGIEQVHKDFCKNVLKVKRTTMNEMIYRELGRVPLIVLRLCRIIKYWLKIIKSESCRLIKVLYNVQLYNTHGTRVNWVSKVRDLLCTYGFGEVWLNQGVSDVNVYFNQFCLRARDMYIHDFHNNLQNNNKAIYYRHLFNQLQPSVYLTCIRNVKYRQVLIYFRTRNHQLMVKTGSWVKKLEDE